MTPLILDRQVFTDRSTVGVLSVGGQRICATLEDTCRRDGIKIHGKTAIPSGSYRLELAFSPKYQRIMPRLVGVENYKGVLIHWGNSDVDSEGCILVGVYNPMKPDWISSSRSTFNALYDRLVKWSEAGPMTLMIRGSRYIAEDVA